MKKRNYGVLPANEKYTILDIFFDDSGLFTCQNCGKHIKNIARIENSKKEILLVGLDCSETLEGFEISNYCEHLDKQKQFANFKNRIAKLNKLKKENRLEIVLNPKTKRFTVIEILKNGQEWIAFNNRNVYSDYEDKLFDYIEKNFIGFYQYEK